MIKAIKAILLTLALALPAGAWAIQVNVGWNWVDGKLDNTKLYLTLPTSAKPGPYPYFTIDTTAANTFEAAVPKGHEIEKWSWGTAPRAETGYENAVLAASGSNTFVWGTRSSDGEVGLGAHFVWLKYELSFDKNAADATGSMDKLIDLVYNESAAFPDCGFTRKGYTFVGWSLTPEGTALSESSFTGDTFPDLDYTNKTINLFAIWQPKTITVNLDAQGGTVTPNPTQYIYDESYQLPTPTRDGYTFAGWYTTATTGGSLVKIEGDKWTIAEDVILYAQWNQLPAKRVQVSKVADEAGADGVVTGGNSFNWGETCYLNATPSTGSRFVGWSKDTKESEIVETASNWSFKVYDEAVYFAHFALCEYTVTFKYKDAEGADAHDVQTVKYGHAATAPAVSAYPHFAFDKWDTTDYLSVKGDLLVNAVYRSTVLTVTFDPNGGEVNAKDRDYDIGDKYGELPVPTRVGYTYGDAWWTDVKYGDKITAESVVQFAGKQTLYPHWTAKKLTVTFDKKGGDTVSMESKEVTFDSLYGTLASAKRTGYEFLGWYGDDAEKVQSSDKVTRSEDHTLTAGWKALTFWVRLNANGGTVDTEEIQVTYDDKYAGLVDAARPGYRFLGWFVSTAADAKQVKNGERVQITANQSLYAQWEAEEYTITFDANGGSASEATRTLTYNSMYGELPTATRKGYRFDGWYNSEDRRVYATTTFKETDDQTLTAKWTANTFTVRFDGNGHTSGSTSNQSFTWDVEQALYPNAFTKTGYTFVGWGESATAETARFGDGEKVSNLAETGTVILYALWKANTYTIAFDRNGALGEMSSIKATYDVEVALPKCTLTWGSNTFKGWLYGGKTYADQMTVRNLTSAADATVTLVAQWSDDYAIDFHGNGETRGEMARQSVPVKTRTFLSPNAYERDGYHFVGWATNLTEAAAIKAKYADGEEVLGLGKSGSTVNLYATWATNTYTVCFYPNGGIGEAVTQRHTYDIKKALRGNDFIRENYRFVGWRADPANSKIDFEDGEEVSNLTEVNEGTVNLYAAWERADSIDNELSEAADCNTTVAGDHVALALTIGEDEELCESVEGGNGTCVRLLPTTSTVSMSAVLRGAGKLTFKYRLSINPDLVGEHYFRYGSTDDNEVYDYDAADWVVGEYLKESSDEETFVWEMYAYYNPDGFEDHVLIDEIKWRPDSGSVATTVGVTFRLNDGTVAPADIVTNVTCKVDSPCGTLPIAVSEGREFLGWATTAAATAANVTEATKVPASDVQLYAVWRMAENPAPTEADKPVITEDFKFTTDARFDYIIKSSPTLSPAVWSEGDLIEGTGEPIAIPIGSEPQMFFKIEVIQRGSK